MRTSSVLLSASVGALVVLGVSTATAWADPVSPALEPGYVSVSVATAAPGETVRVSGTCPAPPNGAALPVAQSLTSPAFTGPQKFSTADPTAFDGTAIIAPDVAAGSHPVTLTCSNGTASTSITVIGGGVSAPTMSHHSSSGAGVLWDWLPAGALVVFGGGAGSAYLLSRRGGNADESDGTQPPTSDSPQRPNERMHV